MIKDAKGRILDVVVTRTLDDQAASIKTHYWKVELLGYKFPQPDPRFAKPAGNISSGSPPVKSCNQFAREVHEPFSDWYADKRKPPSTLPRGTPRAYHQWQGNISRAQFDAVPPSLAGPSCPHCGDTVRYKVLRGGLYKAVQGVSNQATAAIEELLLATLYLHEVPDVDFIVHFGNSCAPDGMPVVGWDLCRHHAQGGFTLPSPAMWSSAMGPTQLATLAQCYITRYPIDYRKPVVFWRGSARDARLRQVNASNAHEASRVRLHRHFSHPNLTSHFDVGLTNASSLGAPLLGSPPKASVPFEDSQQAAVLLDVDGDGPSHRMHDVLHLAALVLKQASNHSTFFEHLVAPGHALEFVSTDLADLQRRGAQLLHVYANPGTRVRLMQRAERMQGLGTLLLNQVALAEATAYTLKLVASRSSWRPGTSAKFVPVPFEACCTHNPLLPREFAGAIGLREGPPSMEQLKAQGVLPGPEGDA